MTKLIFFTYDFPYPTNTGGKNRAYHLLKYATSGFEVFLFSFVRGDFQEAYKDKIREIGVKHIFTFKRKKLLSKETFFKSFDLSSSIFKKLYFEETIANMLIQEIRKHEIDLVHFESFYTSFYISDELKKIGVKQILGTENIEYLLYHDYTKKVAKPLLKPLYNFEARKIEEEEKEMLKKADLALAVTATEAAFINKLTGKKCEIIENGVDLDYFSFKPFSNENHTILFVGNFSYFPNKDAILFFYNQVFKRIVDKNIRLKIVGKRAVKLPFVNDPRVEILEFVDDIKSIYQQASVLISPIRIGGGTNFKVLEAMSCGLPVVANPARVEELGFKDGEHLLFASDASEFSKQLERILADDALRRKIILNARKLIEKEYDWKVIGKKLNAIYKSLVSV